MLDIREMIIQDKIADFKDYDFVRNLIINRIEIESIPKYQQQTFFLSHQVHEYNSELSDYVENLYETLDRYISICDFNEENLKILEYLFIGMDVRDICKLKKIKNQSVFNRIRKIVLKINFVAELERN